MGTANLLQACRSIPRLQAVIVASSDKSYGRHKTLPYTEAYPLQGVMQTYEASKVCEDVINLIGATIV
jgi:CDP-glucose 4,6-dehydratase